jgi:hypothetical protein
MAMGTRNFGFGSGTLEISITCGRSASCCDDESYITAQQNTLQPAQLIKHHDEPATV